MKKILVIIFLLTSFVTYSQSGVGYLNYTTYLTHNGNGSLSQYSQFANNAAGFDAMFNTANSNTLVYKQGTGPAATTININGSFYGGVPRNDYWGVKVTGYFIPKETGLYYFGIDGDDGVDLLINGNVVTSFYGGHGFQGYRIGSINLIAGTTYTIMARFQQYGGGWGMAVAWKRPSQSSYTTQADECYSVVSTPSKQGKINFDFGGTLDKTKFLAGTNTISATGVVDITNAIDSIKVDNGYKATITPGQVEWSLINPYEPNLSGHRLQIDERVVNGTGINLNNIKSVKLFDIYDGPMTPLDFNGWWKQWTIPGSIDLAAKVAASSYQSNIRLQDGWYAFKADYSFSQILEYKPQSVAITTTNNLATLYNSIVTVSDVYLAFKEYSSQGGLFGNSSDGGQFTYGIQYKNADVNDDGIFNETDCYLLLQHLTGKKNIVDTFTLPKTLKLIPTTTYNAIGKSNWNTFPSYLGDIYNFDINTGKPIDTFYLSGTWKGDVNLSHSATPASNGITTMGVKTMNAIVSNIINAEVIGETIGGKLVVTITLDPLQQEVVGTQFELSYNNTALKFEKVEFATKGNPTNYGVDKGGYINMGSLISDGSTTLDKTTQYKVTFSPLQTLGDTLGLTSITLTDAINKNGTQLKINMN